MNKKKLYLVVVIIALLLIGFLYLRNEKGEGEYITAEVVRGYVSEVAKATGEVEDAKRSLKRTNELFIRGIISENDKDVAQTRYDSALAEVKAQEASYENALAQVEQAKASLKSTESDLSYTKIISPVDGIVISRNVDAGQTVSASLQAPTLFVIAENQTKMQ